MPKNAERPRHGFFHQCSMEGALEDYIWGRVQLHTEKEGRKRHTKAIMQKVRKETITPAQIRGMYVRRIKELYDYGAAGARLFKFKRKRYLLGGLYPMKLKQEGIYSTAFEKAYAKAARGVK